ncbi:MAG TPA: F0F1 ATP synthase subunit gamma [Rhizomicrobium sp.]|jgi:F-type H+-transporting ATPase subunit gamma|nr:F0F1 ATP synthase subunit gamma [Rhizomicrobium sp.]
MATVKEMRVRIGSVKSTQKITKALQMVAAAKLRRAQDAAQAARPFAEKMSAVVANLAGGMEGNSGAPALLAGNGKDQVHLLIVMTADRGLCGGFNSNIVRLARQQIAALLRDGKQVKIITVGRKGRDQLKRQYGNMIVEGYDFMGVRQIGFGEAVPIGAKILSMFEAGEFDVATMIYSRFQSVIAQVPTAQQLIPASVEKTSGPTANYTFEPDENEILAELLPRNLTVQIFRALLENVAGEMGAKMTAMDNATRNAGDLINALTIQMNRTRQAKITTELIEIISGASAL